MLGVGASLGLTLPDVRGTVPPTLVRNSAPCTKAVRGAPLNHRAVGTAQEFHRRVEVLGRRCVLELTAKGTRV